jgi:hypothetical protein
MAFLRVVGKYLWALLRRWWALMSCAAFTIIGWYAAAHSKGNEWFGAVMWVAAALMFLVASFFAWKEQYDKAEETASLDIVWKPGEEPYWYPYTLPPDPTEWLHFRVCIVNTGSRAQVDDVEVWLENLWPRTLACVPCHLRLMNNVLPLQQPIERFSVSRDGYKFVDVMAQKKGVDRFWIWHTAAPNPETILAQRYTFTIFATSKNAKRAEHNFCLEKGEEWWEMKSI